MIASKYVLMITSLLFTAVPAIAEDLGPACSPGSPVHEEANFDLNKVAGSWRFIVAPANGCNQAIFTFNGQSISMEGVKIKPFTFAASCETPAKNGEMGIGGLTGKVTATYCYNSLTTKALFRMHQLVMVNTDPNRPYVAGYLVWDSGTYEGKPLLRGVGSDAGGSGVNVWLVGETPPK